MNITKRESVHVVMFPAVGAGHFMPFIEFANHLATHHAVTVTFLATTLIDDSSKELITHANPNITILDIPMQNPNSNPDADFQAFIYQFTVSLMPPVRTVLESMGHVSAFVTDFFCSAMIDVANSLSIPSYVLYTSSAASLLALLYHTVWQGNLSDVADFSTAGPIPVRAVPEAYRSRAHPHFEMFLDHSRRLRRCQGILVNTYDDLEEHALNALKDSEVLIQAPPVYTTGPLVSLYRKETEDKQRNPELTWLDQQPDQSVIYICFGSAYKMPVGQVTEIAEALAGCRHRFLWVVSGEESALGLPEGYEERTARHGLVLRSWASQLGILDHRATVAFVSHCGWNSVLESMWFGVPLIAWPLHIDQLPSGFFLVKEKKAVEVRKEENDGFVRKESMVEAMDEMMKGEEGGLVRNKCLVLREAARNAFRCNANSHSQLRSLISMWERRYF